MDGWQSVYDSEEMVKTFNLRRKIVGIRLEERDEIILDMIPFCEHSVFRILDLGAGMGRFTIKLREQFPKAQIVCLDGSKKMLAIAKSRLEHDETVSFICKDFSKASWIQGIEGKFNAVISIGAIHHVSDVRKRQLFSEVYTLLDREGYFINGDLIKSQYGILNKKYYDDVWARHIQQKTREVLGVERTIDDVRMRMYKASEKEDDKPTTVENQIRWLQEAGFRVAECIWQYYLVAVTVGIK